MMDIDFPLFEPEEYKISFPFFEMNGESFLTLVGRDEVVQKINSIVNNYYSNDPQSVPQKYHPIVVSTSRGMGKTFLLKMIGMQKVKKELQNIHIRRAGSCGRIISFDFASCPFPIQSIDDIKSLLNRLMIFHLCFMFHGRQVAGINFEKFDSFSDREFDAGQERFNAWIKKCLRLFTEDMIAEYIRLTNIAFRVKEGSGQYKTAPVFLFDEIQLLCRSSGIALGSMMHTWLTLLLNQLGATKYKPICISTGTHDGEIISITEISGILPKALSLTPLVQKGDYEQFWREMTEYKNKMKGRNDDVHMHNKQGDEDGDECLIESLICASYQIPRLLFIAHDVWYTYQTQKRTERLSCVQEFESQAIAYYKEMAAVWKNYTVEELSHIILSCSVRQSFPESSSTIPGTKIQWSDLIQRSIIFPYLDDCYLFPFTLIWKHAPKESDKYKKQVQVEKKM